MRGVAVAASIAVITIGVLPWGDFQGHTHWPKVGWIPFVSDPVPIRLRDVVINVMLFTPLGASIASRSTRQRAFTHAAVAGAGISFAAEWAQLYSHTRFPSATDLVANIAGALVGASLLLSWKRL
jgi:VanZ family protein